jgi:dATP pyrophosphohydrolase
MALNEHERPDEAAHRKTYKLPVSVLIVIHTQELDVLLLERADRPGFWQSVTGSQHAGETLAQTALRELREETGIDATSYRLVDWGKHNVYEIYPHWRYRYAPGITHNTEHVFALEVPRTVDITLAPREHLHFAWLPWRAAAEKAFSWSNAEAILELPSRVQKRSDAAPGGT